MKKFLIALSVLALMSCASTPSDSGTDRQPSQVTGNIGKEFNTAVKGLTCLPVYNTKKNFSLRRFSSSSPIEGAQDTELGKGIFIPMSQLGFDYSKEHGAFRSYLYQAEDFKGNVEVAVSGFHYENKELVGLELEIFHLENKTIKTGGKVISSASVYAALPTDERTKLTLRSNSNNLRSVELDCRFL